MTVWLVALSSSLRLDGLLLIINYISHRGIVLAKKKSVTVSVAVQDCSCGDLSLDDPAFSLPRGGMM